MSPGETPNPYVGPYAFRAEDADLFFGRDREVESLASLVIAESIVLFFAQSGTGKTSLLQARLLPDLDKAGFDVLPVARVGAEPPAGMSPANVYVFSALCSLAPDTDAARLQSLTLGTYLWTLPERDDRTTRRVLVFDQFEEILPPRRQHWEEREDFFLQLRQALQDEPSLSVLLVMREDNLAELETYAPLLPGKLRTRFRMESLRRDDAIDAVAKPVETSRPFASGVAEQLVDDLRQVEVDGTAESYRGEFIEPLQLQVVCYELWEKLRERPGKTITADDLAACGDIGQALESFYERAVSKASERSGVPPERIRQWCGHSLITPRRLRSQVDRAAETTAGLKNKAVAELVETRLVRKQEIRGGTWYELVHDRFIEPVLRVNERRLLAESTPLRRDAEAWHQAGRDVSYLYRGQQLAEALTAAPAEPDGLAKLERDFLADSQSEEARRLFQLKQAARLRKLAIALGVMFVAVAALAIYAYWASRRSISRETAAEALDRLDADPGSGLRLSVKAVRTVATPEAETALHRALNASRARQLWEAAMKSANAVAFSPDGLRLAAVGDGGEAYLCDVQSGRVVQRLTGHTAAVTSVSFSPDGRWLATGDSEGTVFVRRATGEPALPPLPLDSGKVNVNGLAFSPDSKSLAVASDSPVPTLWSTETGRKTMDLKGGHEDLVWDVAFSGDGRFLASGGEDKRVILWDLKTGKPRLLMGHSGPVTGVVFQPGKPGEATTLLASSSQDSTARLWDLESGSSAPLFGHKGQVWSVAFSPDGASLATASFDGSAKIWDVVSKDELFNLFPGAGQVVKVAFSPNRDLLAIASHSSGEEDGSGLATAWKVLLHDESPTLTLADKVVGMAFRRDGQLFAAFGKDGRGVLWNPASGSQDHTLCQGAAPLSAVSFSDGGDYVSCTSAKGGVVVVRSGKPGAAVVRLSATEATAEGASYEPAGQLLATVSGKTVKLWGLQRGSWKEIRSFPGEVSLRAVAFSRDGKRLAVGFGNGLVFIRDTETSEIQTKLFCHQGAILALAFSSDGTRLATGSIDHTAKLWDLVKGVEIATFPGHRAAVTSVAFNREGTMLATGDTSGTIRLETLDMEELIARALQRLDQSVAPKEQRR